MSNFIVDIQLSLTTDEVFLLKKASSILNTNMELCVREAIKVYCNDLITMAEKPSPILEVLEEEEVVADQSTEDFSEVQ